MKIKKAKGFTLIELMIVVAIIGILAAIAIPKFADLIRKSNEGATKGNLGALRSAVSIYFADNENYPCGANIDPGTSATCIHTTVRPKYIKAIPSCYVAGYASKDPKVRLADSELPYDDNDFCWGYDGGNSASFNGIQGSGQPTGWGNFWVATTDTDTKSATWSVY